MSAGPFFANRASNIVFQVTTANTNFDGTGAIVDGPTAGEGGFRLDRIVVVGVGTVTDGMVRIFLHNTSAYRLYKEVAIAATTPSTTVQSFRAEVPFGFSIPRGWKISGSTAKTETFNIFVEGGDI